jgi:hypothetical protein
LIADILLKLICKRVIIVCLNNFLAHWAKTTYAKRNLNSLSSKLLYISIDDFLKKVPDNETIVIFDEID